MTETAVTLIATNRKDNNEGTSYEGESWTHYWVYLVETNDIDARISGRELDAIAADCLAKTECYSEGGCTPGGMFHHAPRVAFKGLDSTARWVGNSAVVIVSQTGGYDI